MQAVLLRTRKPLPSTRRASTTKDAQEIHHAASNQPFQTSLSDRPYHIDRIVTAA
jgi:hypothetical protein